MIEEKDGWLIEIENWEIVNKLQESKKKIENLMAESKKRHIHTHIPIQIPTHIPTYTCMHLHSGLHSLLP